MMTKGFIQLALRSGQYRNINVTEIYADEFSGEDILSGEVILEAKGDGDRAHGRTNNIVGYVAYLEFINGFRKNSLLEHGENLITQRNSQNHGTKN